jgi:hypothetical protein
MLVGILQIFNPNLLLNQGSPRIIATLGNAIYVGGYGMFLIFVSFLLFLKEENKILKNSIQKIMEQINNSARKEDLIILQRQFDLFRNV